MPPNRPNRIAYRLNSPVTSISARNRGTTRFLTGSTPSTCSASSSSRILRAPRSAVIAVPATPASTIAVISGPISRIGEHHEEPAEPIGRAEDRQKVLRLQARRPVADGDRGQQQRQPAQAQREQELRHELAAVRVRRAQGRRRSSCPSGASCPRLPPAGSSPGALARSGEIAARLAAILRSAEVPLAPSTAIVPQP